MEADREKGNWELGLHPQMVIWIFMMTDGKRSEMLPYSYKNTVACQFVISAPWDPLVMPSNGH